MELRDALRPPVVPPQRVEELSTAIQAIAALLERGEPAGAAIMAFNVETGHHFTANHFVTYWESRDVEDFALEAARPARPKVPNVTRDELIEIVRRIRAVDEDSNYYLLVLETNVANPGVTDLIFNPPAQLANASPEAIVDAALSYRPIAL
jgi:hypothetical protein